MKKDLPIILGISGASGVCYAFDVLKFLLKNDYIVHLILTNNSFQVIKHECDLELSSNIDNNKNAILGYLNLKDKENNLILEDNNNIATSISSGSYLTQGMIILPCSMNTLAAIHAGIADSLLTRAADVCIKSGNKLVIAPREMPFSPIHLRNMYELSLMGVKIVVPNPAFYNKPETINDMIGFVSGKILDVFEVPNDLYKRWK